jgi:hypothetical protein
MKIYFRKHTYSLGTICGKESFSTEVFASFDKKSLEGNFSVFAIKSPKAIDVSFDSIALSKLNNLPEEDIVEFKLTQYCLSDDSEE